MTIAIIDKHPIVRVGIQAVLKQHFGLARILESNAISSFHDDLHGEIPDLVILSISRQNVNSNIQTLDFIRDIYRVSRIIVYDGSVDSVMIRMYFQCGVSGYLCKTGVLTELVTCVEKILKGEPYVSIDMIYAFIKDGPFASNSIHGL